MIAGEPPKSTQGTSRDLAIEGLRGLAALVVFYVHLVLNSTRGWSPPGWLVWPFDASAAVMIFFVLSGYVIGLTNRGVATADTVRGYAWRRILRLTPVNLAAVLLACVAANEWDIATIATHLLFLENYAAYAGVWVPVIHTNGNLWSLNHEVVYYALFAALWFFRARIALVAIGSLAVLLLGWYTPYVPVFLACYGAGFLFWLTGLALAWQAAPADSERAAWPSALLLALVTWKLQFLQHLVSDLPMPMFAGPTVKLYQLDFLPVATWLVAAVARRTFPLLRWVKVAAFAMPALGLIINVLHPGPIAWQNLVAVGGAYALALLLARWRPALAPFRFAAPLGAISFALYAFARPIEFLVFEHPALPGGMAGFIAAAFLTIVLSFGLAWLFECRVQPALNQKLALRKPMPPTGAGQPELAAKRA